MSNRKRLARERLEAYFVYLLLAYRPLILISGLFLLVYSVATILNALLLGSALIMIAAILLLLGSSFPVVLYTARLGAWIATLTIQD